jgi:hypothetical protein
MNKYIIEITRTTYSYHTVDVTADSKHDALSQARDLATLDLDFSTDHVDYDYDIVTTLPPLDD